MNKIFQLIFTPQYYLKNYQLTAQKGNPLIIILMCILGFIFSVGWTWFFSIRGLWREHIIMLLLSGFCPAFSLFLQSALIILLLKFLQKQVIDKVELWNLVSMFSVGLIGSVLPSAFFFGPGFFVASLIQGRILFYLCTEQLLLSKRRALAVTLIVSPLILMGVYLILPFASLLGDALSGLVQRHSDPVRFELVVPRH